MTRLADLQTQFLDYLSSHSMILTASVVDQGAISVETRLGIYKNAYHIRLKQALETDHEILGVYLGDVLFDKMVEGYVQQHPSHYTSLRHFGEALPQYLSATEPFGSHPIIAEIARFERWLLNVFDAAEIERLPFSALQNIPAPHWPELRFRFHPSMQLLTTQWNSIESWKSLKNQQEPPEMMEQPNRYWMLWRSTALLSEFRPLTADEHQFLSLAVAGDDFATLCESLLEWHDAPDIGPTSIEFLSRWFEQGVITHIDFDDPRSN